MLKYCVGIDVSKNDLHCCIAIIDQLQKVTIKASKHFINSKTGFTGLSDWINKQHKDRSVPLVMAMEATGVYYEQLALYLFKHQYAISVVLPNKAKRYLQSTGLKSKNDKIDAQGLARMGSEQSLSLWHPLDTFFYELRELTRQQQSLQELKTSVGNQLHASELGMYQIKLVIKQQKNLIASIEKQITVLEDAIEQHLQRDSTVKEKVAGICKIKGLGLMTVAVILAETNGFALFENSRQLVSYAGYDVEENESGTHKGRTRITKKGNSRIRRILHMPAFNMIRYEQTPFLNLFNRTFQKHGQKMKSYVAIQKKLLTIIFALWKNNSVYQPNYGVEFTGEMELVPSSLHTLKESSAYQKAALPQGRPTVENSQFASSLQE